MRDDTNVIWFWECRNVQFEVYNTEHQWKMGTVIRSKSDTFIQREYTRLLQKWKLSLFAWSKFVEEVVIKNASMGDVIKNACMGDGNSQFRWNRILVFIMHIKQPLCPKDTNFTSWSVILQVEGCL
ncbi:hypothetical protein C0J52_02911 [Blattella germanica]|nr:hypothetical protein C0J52_02911 [Blattella germanica]